jgi:hypothetical protein
LDFVINFRARAVFFLRVESVRAIQWAPKNNAFNFILNLNDGQEERGGRCMWYLWGEVKSRGKFGEKNLRKKNILGL